MSRPEREGGTEVVEKPKSKTKRPQLFNVVLYNDDYTTMQFVVEVLQSVFRRSHADAMRIQYGGSVKPANMVEFMSQPHIDGALVMIAEDVAITNPTQLPFWFLEKLDENLQAAMAEW